MGMNAKDDPRPDLAPAPGHPLPGVGDASAAAAPRWVVGVICTALAALTLAVFGQTVHHEFVNYDDDTFLTDNPTITHGLSVQGVKQAFAHRAGDDWDPLWAPLTTLSHMLDCQFYGLHPGGHHLTNVLLHTVSVILLFLVLRSLTGALWPSAFAAALFAVHPLHVESVAWVSERKDVLSGLFFMLTLWAYARYVTGPPRLSRYLLVVLFFVLGLMSKTMLVTMPFVLLLLDYWPLQRNSKFKILSSKFENGAGDVSFGWLVMEKIPLLALAAATSLAAIFTQGQGGALVSIESSSASLRMANALVSYAAYLGRTIWPAGLAAYYPYPSQGLPVMKVMAALLVMVSLTALAWFYRRKLPFLLVGWLWFIGMLVPVIGLVQVGIQAQADRYTYLPQIGLVIALAWLVDTKCVAHRQRRLAFGIAMAGLMAFAAVAGVQTSYWRDSEALWRHAAAVTPDNFITDYNLGLVLQEKGLTDDAIVQFRKALEIKADYPKAHFHLGNVLRQKGLMDEAIAEYQLAVAVEPNYAAAHNNLGIMLRRKGRLDDAISEFQKALEARPDYADAYNNLGNVLMQEGRADEAMAQYQKALDAKPEDAQAHYNLGSALLQERRMDEAIPHLRKALELRPDYPAARERLAQVAWLLATGADASAGDGSRALMLAEQADKLPGKDPGITMVLAASYAACGRFPEAIDTVQQAIQMANLETNAPLAASLQAQLKSYQAGLPLRIVRATNAPAAQTPR